MNLLRSLIWLLVCILLSGCRQNKMDITDNIAVIEVEQHLGKYQTIPVSEIMYELEYIPLEANDDCLIGEYIYHVIVTEKYIFVSGTDYCYAFNRNGRFIGKIGSVGQGPGEYFNITGLSTDEKKRSLYLETYRSILEYSFEGDFRQSINKPLNGAEESITRIHYVHDNLFIGHNANRRSNDMYNFCLFNDSGQFVKFFDNHGKFEWTTYGLSFKTNQHIYVKAATNDTLYYLNEKDELIPQFVFNLGKHAYPDYLKKEGAPSTPFNSLKDVVLIPHPNRSYPLIGTPDHIFFSIEAFRQNTKIPLPKGIARTINLPDGQSAEVEVTLPLGIYDITNKTTRLLDTNPISRKLGLINDLDGGLSFWPKYSTSDNELVGIWQAYEMKEILTEEYFAAHEIKNPQAHQKLKELLKKLEWDDNPVVVIGKIK